jgi:hypothetical protein
MSPTAPLRVRNKSPSPVKASSSIVDSSRSRQELMTVEGNSLPRGSTTADAALVASPRQMGSPPPQPSNTAVTGPLSPRPQGPRSPVPKALISTPKLGSAHTRLRVLSGGGRRVSAGRETIPLKGDENSSPSRITPTVQIAYKRQHSEDQLQPRKRSPSRSPLEPRIVDPSQILPEPLKVPSLSKRSGSRRSSGVRTPRRSSGPLTTPRMVSSETASIQAATGATGEDEVMSVHADVQDAIEAARQKVS